MPGKEIKGRSKIANYRHGGRIGFKEGMGAAKSRKKAPWSQGESKTSRPPSQLDPKQKPKPRPPEDGRRPESPEDGRRPESPEGGRRPGPGKGFSPKPKPKVGEDWAAKGGRIGFKKGTDKNGPVRPIDLPWPTPENPVPSKKKKKRK